MVSWSSSAQLQSNQMSSWFCKSQIRRQWIVLFCHPSITVKQSVWRKAMSEPVTKDQQNQDNGDGLRDDIDAVHDESRVEPTLWERISRFMNSGHERRNLTKTELSKDRTQSLRLLIAGIVGAILLF